MADNERSANSRVSSRDDYSAPVCMRMASDPIPSQSIRYSDVNPKTEAENIKEVSARLKNRENRSRISA